MPTSCLFRIPSLVKLPSLKLVLLCFVAISPSLGTAVSAIGRVVLFFLALLLLIVSIFGKKKSFDLVYSALTISILAAIFYMGLSTLWSDVAVGESLNAWARHARILSIVLIIFVISSQSEARVVLRAFVAGQVFVVLSAWLLVFSADVPWATAASAKATYAVFGSYLEQSISQAVLAAILWFERDWIFGRRGCWAAILLAFASVVLTLGYMSGRTGTVVCLALICFAIFKQAQRRLVAFSGVVVLAAVLLSVGFSKTMVDRFLIVKSEISEYSQQSAKASSSGQRLLYWQVSLELIAQRPIFGYGAGSWNKHYQAQHGGRASDGTLTTLDPHQLFLLWAVEGGLLGLALLIGVLSNIYLVSRKHLGSNDLTTKAVLIALIVSGLFNSMIYGIGMGDFFCIAFGIVLYKSTQSNTVKKSGPDVKT